MKTSELLRKAKALIDSPEKWTQGQYARDTDGDFTPVSLDSAVCFCSSGAIHKIWIDHPSHKTVRKVREFLNRAMGGEGIAYFNDTNTHAEVMEAWDMAIALAESKGD